MKITELFESQIVMRISHPEDLIFDDGSKGALNAVNALTDAASSSKTTSIKMDGSPVLIAGNVNGQFVMTDKYSLAKQMLPKTPKEMFHLVYDRKPDQENRANYGNQVAKLFTYVQKAIPKNLKGLLKFDVMWFEKPPVKNGNFQIMPNKVLYEIPVNSELGKEVAQSECGIVVHSMYDKSTDMDSHAIEDVDSLGLTTVKGLVVLSPKFTTEIPPDKKSIGQLKGLENFIKKNAKKIDTFFNKAALSQRKITDLPAVMKTFMASLSRAGKEADNLDKMFLSWLSTAKVSDSKKQNITQYIQQNPDAYTAIMVIVGETTEIKNNLFQLYHQNTHHIKASIGGVPSHEGYVVNSPAGKIKLVNRPLFMRS